MKTCGTCKYWELIPDSNPRSLAANGFGTCENVRMWEDDEIHKEEKSKWLACAIDGSGYFAALKTKESFGCVLHEERSDG